MPTNSSSSNDLVRLQKILRDRFGVSRRHAEEWIEKGWVTVNKEKADLGKKVDPEKDIIILDPSLNIKPLSSPPPTTDYQLQTPSVLALHKPAGYVTTRFDPQKRPTIYDLIPKKYHAFFPVGRLDLETEGLILLTNDGDLCFQLTHPKFEVEKEYYAKITRPITPENVEKIRQGLHTEEIQTAPCKVEVINPQEMILILHEGQKREIRRMFIALGYHVFYLKRIRFASIELANLARGKFRELEAKEIASLKKSNIAHPKKRA